jgi:hypothetical protein
MPPNAKIAPKAIAPRASPRVKGSSGEGVTKGSSEGVIEIRVLAVSWVKRRVVGDSLEGVALRRKKRRSHPVREIQKRASW